MKKDAGKKHFKVKKPKQNGKVKVPVIMQLEALECGAACLAMILAYYGKWIPLEQVRVDCGVSRDGSNAKNILVAARNYGLNAKGYRFEPDELKKRGSFPCIIHWEFNHFVVLDGFKNGKVYLNDPARGAYTVSEERFDEGFTGIVLMFDPKEDFEPFGKEKSMLDFARKRMKGTGPAIIFVILTTMIGSLFGIIKPGFASLFIDRILTKQNPEWTNPFMIAFIGMCAIEVLIAWMKTIYSLRINGKMSLVGNSTFMWKVLRLPMEFFSQRMCGDIMQRQGTNASIASTFVDTLAPLAINTVTLIFYFIVMVRYSLILTLVGLIPVFTNVFLSRLISAKRVNISRVMLRDQGNLDGTSIAGIEMIETIKANGAEDTYFEKWSGYQASVNSGNNRYIKLNSTLGLLPTIISEVINIAVIGLGILLTFYGKFTVGMVLAFQTLLADFMNPFSTLTSAGQTIQEMRTEMERVEDVMEYPIDPVFNERPVSENEEMTYDKLTGNVEIKNLTFGYSRLAAPLIKDFSMTLKQGSKVAFVGASGCGKSTLAKLISGLYQPWSGEILFDGKSIMEIDRNVFTSSLAVVDQDIILFEDTIANNIRMWDNSIKDFEVIMAARDAQLHSAILQREGGYDYTIREGGKDFSGGERQRMEIARVLAQDPTIIVMDEATSALDAKTEKEVVESIVARGITCIVVAHRLSTIRDCDEIIVLDHGEVVERGTHEELYKLNGYYTQLVSND